MKEVDFIKSVGYRNVQRVLYEGMRHEILNETQKQWVYDDVLSYLAKIFGGKS
jgi:alpha-beta hydrolase superfamily lysophospholipase